jgi:small conductance mechanosensitive channel
LVNRWARRLIGRFVQHATASDQFAASALQRIGVTPPSALVDVDPRAEARARTLSSVLKATASALIWTTATLMIFDAFNVNLGPLVASAGIAGVAVGFGAQALVRDCISGFFMLLEDQFGVGDSVDLGAAVGTVEALTLRSTRLRSTDGTVWHVPNGQIVRVANRSKLWSRAILDVTVAYDADVDRALEVMRVTAAEVCARPEIEPVVLEPPVISGVESLTLEGLVLRVTVKTAADQQAGVMRQLRAALKLAFDEAGIRFPGSQPAEPVAAPQIDADD